MCCSQAKDIPLLPGFLSFLCSLTRCLAPARLKLRHNGAIQIYLLLLLSFGLRHNSGFSVSDPLSVDVVDAYESSNSMYV